MRSALFVDFDNVYSGLERLGPGYAEAFARQPAQWLAWLTDTVALPPGSDAPAGTKRRILVRRCYLNPEPYKRFRIGFLRAGFEIVDCPPMTAAGKTSTDIHMVLDIVDVLQASTRYDEFIVFSADADFTPVLRKLRREDRRTTIFAAGATSASYDASGDLIIDPEAFIRDGLGFGDEDPPPPPDLEQLLLQAEAVARRSVDEANQPVLLPVLTKALATQLPQLPATGWAGKGTFLALLKSLPLAPLRIDRELNALLDPRRLQPRAGTPPPEPAAGADTSANALAHAPAVAPLLEAAGLPQLPPGRYRLLLESLALALQTTPFSLAAVTKQMRDRCAELQAPVSREHCNSLVRLLLFNGFVPGRDPQGVDDLVLRCCSVVAAAAAREGLKVDDEQRQALLDWASQEG